MSEWQPIETAPEHWMADPQHWRIGDPTVRVTHAEDGRLILLWWDNDTGRVSHWREIERPQTDK